jgi:hypothetical protein
MTTKVTNINAKKGFSVESVFIFLFANDGNADDAVRILTELQFEVETRYKQGEPRYFCGEYYFHDSNGGLVAITPCEKIKNSDNFD